MVLLKTKKVFGDLECASCTCGMSHFRPLKLILNMFLQFPYFFQKQFAPHKYTSGNGSSDPERPQKNGSLKDKHSYRPVTPKRRSQSHVGRLCSGAFHHRGGSGSKNERLINKLPLLTTWLYMSILLFVESVWV